jgi:hypothetical protein
VDLGRDEVVGRDAIAKPAASEEPTDLHHLGLGVAAGAMPDAK